MGAKTLGSQGSGNGVQHHNNTWMTKEGSLYSLTLNEVEHQLSHLEKPLGSMNLDELLKTVWSAEATTQGTSSSVQWQPEFVVSSDLSNKTVDEVWRSIQHKRRKNEQIMKVHERPQPVLGEMTLEDFLAKAGIVSRQTGDDLDSFDEFCPRSNWMQYELTPVEHTHACQQQLTHRKKGAGSGEVVERRQKRMIKNRESAARSRARKQAYTNELENKISILEEEIELLKKQQAAEKEVQCAPPPEPKFQLRRTNSGPL